MEARPPQLAFQTGEKADRAAELVIADEELAFQNEEKDKRAAELVLADRELIFQTGEKADRAAELIIAKPPCSVVSGKVWENGGSKCNFVCQKSLK